MEDLENATPFELAWPSANSSAAISLYDFWPPLGSLRRRLFGQLHDFRALLGMAQAALDPRAGRTLAITGGFEFGNKARLLVLMKSPCELPHHDARWITVVGQVLAVGRQHTDAAGNQ